MNYRWLAQRAVALVGVLAIGCASTGGAAATGSGSDATSTTACSKVGPPAGNFTSNEAIAAATCLARQWHADAILDGVAFGPATKGWLAGGTDFDWTVTFVSPGTQCPSAGGTKALPNKTFDVNSKYPTIGNPGSDCIYPIGVAGCPPGVGTPPDSSAVYAAAMAKFQAMAGGATVVVTGMIAHSCVVAPLPVTNYISWVVTGSWTGASGKQMGIVKFDESGSIKSSVGPCASTDFTCLGG